MKLNKLHNALVFLLCATTVACNKNTPVQNGTDQSGKTPITLSIGGVDSQNEATKAVITDGTGKTMNNFDKSTKIFMIMKSMYYALPSPYDYLNYGGDQTTKYTVSRGDVAKNTNVVSFDEKNSRYWDDAHARSSKLDIWAYAQKGMDWKTCAFAIDDPSPSDPNVPFKKKEYNTENSFSWQTASIYPMIFNWNASHIGGAQNETTVMCQDLLFSNNLVDNSSTGTNIGGTDARLAFNTSTRKFPQEGEALMKFYHAMSKITIKIKEGDGFDKSSTTDFQFTSGNVRLSGFNTEGLFSIQMGGFQQINSHSDIPSIYLKTTSTTTAPYYTLEALTVPNIDDFMQTYVPAKNDEFSRFTKGKKDYSTDVMMEFVIDNNKYQLTSGQLYDALVDNSDNPVTHAIKKTNNGTYIPLEAGKNYVFTFTVSKTKIDNITATVADWEDVEAEEQEPSNARIELQVEDRSGSHTSPVTSNMDIYRALDEASSVTDSYVGYRWTTGYSGKATWNNTTLTYNTNRWSTDWFWESNKTYYHFRTLSPTTQVVSTETSKPDYTLIQSATCTTEAGYNQMAWGAPFKAQNSDYKFTYSPTRGFDGTAVDAQSNPIHQIYQAIGPVKEHETHPIKILMFHMFSGVHFTVKTTETADKVKLYDPSGSKRTKVELIAYYPEGRVRLGTGLVDASGTVSTETSPYIIPFGSATADTEYVSQEYFHSVIPQDLTNVVLVITTPDDNQYKIPMKDLTTSSITSNNIANPYSLNSSSKYVIDRWYPGFKYNYTFKLKKTGIDNIQATIVDWENVDVDEGEVTIQ